MGEPRGSKDPRGSYSRQINPAALSILACHSWA